MNICVVGWYGTETMGDRAILDGLLCVFERKYENAHVFLGSLYPFFSERTLIYDEGIYKCYAPHITISVFDIKNRAIRNKYINQTDVVIMGGGPLMDLQELYIILDVFSKARKKGLETYIMGCGIGPLFNAEYISVVDQIFSNARKISLRDKFSVELANLLWGKKYDYKYIGDPAVISIENYKRNHDKEDGIERYVAVNYRDYPQSEYGGKNNICENELSDLVVKSTERIGKTVLVPMHTFCIGGDDRFFFSKLMQEVHNKSVEVIHNPLDLHELYKCYMNAYACIGMRYHAVVMQTVLNGNNYILNYTDVNSGKIGGYIDCLKNKEFYKNRIHNMQDENATFSTNMIINELQSGKCYDYSYTNIDNDYVNFLE